MDFGYEDEVLYPLTFTVAPTVKNGPAIIDAQVDWLVCSDRCIPGKAEIKATLDLTSTQPPVVVAQVKTRSSCGVSQARSHAHARQR